ncbi:MAG: NAD-dependent epimerase/dehydratase family protein [Thermomicrobiales bacterium]
MARALVTGASGFVGANLARRLLADGHDVHLLLRPGHAPWRVADLAGHAEIHPGDLADADSVAAVFRAAKPEQVFHLAAHGAYSWQQDPAAMIAGNVTGTMNLARTAVASGVSVMVNTGSSSEYGLKDHAPSENETLEPNSAYAVTKAAGTHFCRLTARAEGVPIPTLRLYSVYGSWEEPGRLMPDLLRAALTGVWPPLANPDTARDFVFVDDVCDAFILAAAGHPSDPGAIWNVGSGRQTTLREIVAVTRELLSVSVNPVWETMPGRSWDTTIWVSDPRKIERELGWRATTTLHDGLAATAAWLEKHPLPTR